MPKPIRFSFTALLERVSQAIPVGVMVYLVGGALRDELLHRPVHDLDFVVAGEAIKVSRQVADRMGAAFFPMDAEHDVGRCILTQSDGSRLVLDFTAMRGPDLESDLRLRDFTINAMAVDLRSPETLIDPLHGGQDLHDQCVRACSPSTFLDDPLRILRGIRLAIAFQLKFETGTLQYLKAAIPGLSSVSPERLRDEIFRILEGKQPGTAMRMMDILGVTPLIMPELTGLKQVTQSAPHTLDVWEHTLATLDRLEQVLEVLSTDADLAEGANWAYGLLSLRLGRYRQQLFDHLADRLNPDRSLRSLIFSAALYHDAGKPATRTLDETGRIRFYTHDEVSAQLAARWGRDLHLSNHEIDRLVNMVRGHMRPNLFIHSHELPSRRAIYRFYREYGKSGVDIVILSIADTLATYGATLPRDTWIFHLDVARALLEAWWEKPQESVRPPILLTGHDLMDHFGLQEGPQIGQLLEAVREAQAIGFVNSRSDALDLVRERLK